MTKTLNQAILKLGLVCALTLGGIVTVGTTAILNEAAEPSTAYAYNSIGWRYGNGGWWYQTNYASHANYYATGWKQIDNSWYYFDKNGWMKTGWQKVKEVWYYFKSNGEMAANEWIGNYYLKSNGSMATSQWIGDYHVNASGLWDQTKSNSRSMHISTDYFDLDLPATWKNKVSYKWSGNYFTVYHKDFPNYHLLSIGVSSKYEDYLSHGHSPDLFTGWTPSGMYVYVPSVAHISSLNRMIGFVNAGQTTITNYFASAMSTLIPLVTGNTLTYEQVLSYNGQCPTTAETDYIRNNICSTIKLHDPAQRGWRHINDTWYYYNSNNEMQTGWQRIGGKWYYFRYDSGAMATGWLNLGNWYYLNSSGAMQTGWQKIGGKWYYLNSSGEMLYGWQRIGGKWYHLNESGAMDANKWVGNYYVKSDGSMATNQKIGQYYVGADGLWDGAKTNQDSLHIETNSYTIDLPASWKDKVSYTTEGDTTRVYIPGYNAYQQTAYYLFEVSTSTTAPVPYTENGYTVTILGKTHSGKTVSLTSLDYINLTYSNYENHRPDFDSETKKLYSKYIDLQTHGAITFEQVKKNPSSYIGSQYFKEFLNKDVIPAITLRK